MRMSELSSEISDAEDTVPATLHVSELASSNKDSFVIAFLFSANIVEFSPTSSIVKNVEFDQHR